MVCYFCGSKCYNDGSDCPSVCPAPACRAQADDPEKWQAFLAAKEAHIIEVMRQPGGRPYIHLMPRDEGRD